ncbi:thiamine pyrophosphate-binding protein [Cupriavidus plantarum]|uniref:Acetolactate synthase large subunit n=1 Tax=Cupriavidus plantarum TaxID=942865 RepID=A0A316F1U4_9BURK|nr:thiamine pyrophosphate-binding protein [Cupriavidus plantarum]PWK37493.1 acetolactate synthase large subunit [Cupriavidus plantarum]REF01762.1 acetolactate synthase-1/2/3 large subunit [Cupriavidus plantarum]
MTAPTPSFPARTGGRVLVDQLRIHGTDRIFCVPGESFLDVLDALHDQPAIDLVVCKHEGAAANMAEADGKLTGKPGVCIVTRGPGATHASIGVHIAQQDSTPMIMFVGQIAREQKGREAFQEVDYVAVFGTLAKWAVEIDDPARIPEIVARAFQVATSGRPGPVVIALPEDVLDNLCETVDAAPYRVVSAAPRPEDAAALAAALASAKRPLVIAGGANWTAATARDFAAFVKAWNLPVACAFRRQDTFDNRDPHYVGHLSLGVSPKLAERVRSADLIVAFGTRLGDIATDSYTLLEVPRPVQKLVHIHADNAELGRVYQADLPIHAGVEPGAAMLASLKPAAAPGWGEWTAGARAEHEAFVAVPRPHPELTGVDMAAAMAHLNDVLPADSVLTNGAGNYTVWLHRFYAYKQPRTELAPTCGAMGYGLPAAIAAKLRSPEKTVIALAGDGCFLMYPQEIATAAAHGANLIVVVVNNGMYGTIRMHQERRYPGRQSGTTIPSPDFVGMARACGAVAERIERTEDFPAALERARAAGQPALIELVTDPRQITPAMRVADLPA